MANPLDEILKDLGWDSGFHVPVANVENQALEKELAALVLKKTKLGKNFDDANEKLTNFKNHLKHIHQETVQNQNLLLAYHQQVDNENHKLKLLTSEEDRINSDMRHMNKKQADLEYIIEVKQKDLARNAQQLDKIRTEASWDSEALKAWEDSLKKRDEDNEILKKFSAEDQRKATELEAKRKNLQIEVNERRNMLEKMNIDITNSENAMSRTGKILKQMEEERAAMVRQWQESVKNLRQRDADIEHLDKNTEKMHFDIMESKDNLQEEKNFLANEQNNNKKLVQETEEFNFINSKIRREIMDYTDSNVLTLNEVVVRKKTVEARAKELEKARIHFKQLKADFKKEEEGMEVLRNEYNRLNAKYEQNLNKNLTANDRINEVELMLQDSERQMRVLDIELRGARATFIKRQEELQEAKQINTTKHAELAIAEQTLRSIRKRFAKAQTNLIHQKQILSDQEMKVACLEAKLGNLEGEMHVEEDIIMWNNTIKELETSLAEQGDIKMLLQSQILKLQKETLRLISTISIDSKKLQQYKDKLQEFILMIEGGTKQATAAKLRTQQKQVDENVLKLKVDKLSKAMSREDKEIYNLQRYRLELETVMKERQVEVQTAIDVLNARKRNIDEERGRLKADISLRILRTEQCRNKYELALDLLGRDETGAPISISLVKVKSAQEKFMLQQEGDDLDQKVRKAESEIVAMENTLKIVNLTNHSFKNSLEAVDKESTEARELKKLESILMDHNKELRERKLFFISKQEIVRELEAQIKEFNDKSIKIREGVCENKNLCSNLEKEEQDRQDKILRTDKQINSCKKHIPQKQLVKYDKDLYIRQLQETNKTIRYLMADFAVQNPEVAPNIHKHMQDYNLELPPVRTELSTISSDSIKTASSKSSGKNSSINLCNVTCLELKLDDDNGSNKNLKTQKKN